MVQNQNAMNSILLYSLILLNANNSLKRNHIQNVHHQDLTGNTTPNINTTELKQHTSPTKTTDSTLG